MRLVAPLHNQSGSVPAEGSPHYPSVNPIQHGYRPTECRIVFILARLFRRPWDAAGLCPVRSCGGGTLVRLSKRSPPPTPLLAKEYIACTTIQVLYATFLGTCRKHDDLQSKQSVGGGRDAVPRSLKTHRRVGHPAARVTRQRCIAAGRDRRPGASEAEFRSGFGPGPKPAQRSARTHAGRPFQDVARSTPSVIAARSLRSSVARFASEWNLRPNMSLT